MEPGRGGGGAWSAAEGRKRRDSNMQEFLLWKRGRRKRSEETLGLSDQQQKAWRLEAAAVPLWFQFHPQEAVQLRVSTEGRTPSYKPISQTAPVSSSLSFSFWQRRQRRRTLKPDPDLLTESSRETDCFSNSHRFDWGPLFSSILQSCMSV